MNYLELPTEFCGLEEETIVAWEGLSTSVSAIIETFMAEDLLIQVDDFIEA